MFWVNRSPQVIKEYIQRRRKEIGPRDADGGGPTQLAPVIQELHDLIVNDTAIHSSFNKMLTHGDDTNEPITLLELFGLLNKAIAEAPACDPNIDHIGVPLYAIVKHFMEKAASSVGFINHKVNAQFEKIFADWTKFLCSPQSCHTLGHGLPGDGGWLACIDEHMKKKNEDFSSVFVCDKTKPHWGFTSWDHFFTRALNPSARPVSDPFNNRVVNVACESTVSRVAANVKESDTFWIKDQSYSLTNMLNNHNLASQFAGGTLIQTTLSPLAYHRWHSPINGRVIEAVLVPGTSFTPNPVPDNIFPVRPKLGVLGAISALNPTNANKGVSTTYSTRALIFIESDDPDVGLVCFVGVGLAEISTCEITVAKGQKVKKGDELGMFRFGGSSHCLVFRKATGATFSAVKPEQDITVNQTLAYLDPVTDAA